MTAEAPTMRRTPLYDKHAELGAKMVAFAGYEMPIQYEGIVAEHRAVRGRAGLFDLSHMGEFFFKGHGAGATLDRLISSDIAGSPGKTSTRNVSLRRGSSVLTNPFPCARGFTTSRSVKPPLS